MGWHSVTPRLFCDDPKGLVEFLKRTFGATGDFFETRPAEITIGDSIVMVSATGPRAATHSCLYVYVDDVDATFRRAVEAGGTSVEEPDNMPWGDRRGIVTDTFGNDWQIATRNDAG